MKKIRVLSIDGGGIRGILPGTIIDRLEVKLQEKTNKDARISDYFDFFAGTSTGGILTLAYLAPGEANRPKLTAKQALNIYLERGDEIFDVSTWQKIHSVNGIMDEKYDAFELEEALNDVFQDLKLSDLLKPCAISSYDIRQGKPHFFKQHKSKDKIYDFKVKDVARATSAAPTYFETARIKNTLLSPYSLIDGGVFVNNPALVAYSEVRTMAFDGYQTSPTAKDMIIVSVGTGSESKGYEYQKAKDWGAIGWIKPVIEIMMSGNSKTVDYHLKQIFDTLSDEDKNNYHRLEPKCIEANLAMDDASLDNMSKLHDDALKYISTSEINDELDLIVKKLIDNHEE
jgi:patatin-like phospholipase/acyl hydrolase